MPTECPACIASRRTTVEAYVLGWLAGSAYVRGCVAKTTDRDIMSDFCFPHLKMIVEAEKKLFTQFLSISDETLPNVTLMDDEYDDS